MSDSRQPRRVSRDKLTGLVVALACLAFSAVGLKVNDAPEFEYVDGVRSAAISIDGALLTVGEVRVGTRLVRDGTVQAETAGMFVSVETTLAVPGPRKVSLTESHLITQHRTYENWASSGIAAEPGFGTTQDLVFEVDPSQIDDLTLEIWYAGVLHGFYQRGRIHLGITADNAEAWRQAAAGRNLEPDLYGSPAALP